MEGYHESEWRCAPGIPCGGKEHRESPGLGLQNRGNVFRRGLPERAGVWKSRLQSHVRAGADCQIELLPSQVQKRLWRPGCGGDLGVEGNPTLCLCPAIKAFLASPPFLLTPPHIPPPQSQVARSCGQDGLKKP